MTSLDTAIERLRTTPSYNWRLQEVRILDEELVGSLSLMTRSLIGLALDRAPARTMNHLYSYPWREDTSVLGHWRNMLISEQVEALIVLVSEIHEVLHHVDFLCTPFGAALQTRTMREYWGLQSFAPILIERPELMPSRLIEFEQHARQLGLSDNDPAFSIWPRVWLPLRGLLAHGDGFDVWPHGGIEVGWGSNQQPFNVLGQAFEKIWVHGIYGTVRRHGDTNWYLRALTFIETRAVANMLLYIFHFLGEDGRKAAAEMIRLLYRQPDTKPDYLVLLDIFARRWGYPSIEGLLLRAEPDKLRTVLIIASGTCWYALHARPPAGPGDTTETNPAFRFLAAAYAVDQLMEGTPPDPFPSMAEILRGVDSTNLAKLWKVVPAADAINHARAVVARDRERNATTQNPDMRAHFAATLDRLDACLGTRLDGAYGSELGMPNDGSPLGAPELHDPKVRQAITRNLTPSESVRDWFNTRDGLLFRFAPRQRKINALLQHFRIDTIMLQCEQCTVLNLIKISRFSDKMEMKCGHCGAKKIISRDDCCIV